jgi:CheY-like chemotaxis protein
MIKKELGLAFILIEFVQGDETFSSSDSPLLFYILPILALLLLLTVAYFIFIKPRSRTAGHIQKKGDPQDVLESYKIQTQNIPLEKQPFRLSGMLHVLTNKVSDILKEKKHTIYYDIDRALGRYIVGNNDYIEQVLEVLVKNAASLNDASDIIVSISKHKKNSIVFDVSNPDSAMKQSEINHYVQAEEPADSQTELLNHFIKAKQIAKAMQGSIKLKSTKRSGTHYIFTIPYIKDENDRSNQKKLKKVLDGKRVLFIGKSKFEMKQGKYIFETYNTKFEEMLLEQFEQKRPDLLKYDIAVLRSSSLTPAQIFHLQKLHDNTKNDLKIIVIHDLFESQELINRSKSIADAEIYRPMILGDIEEILYQIFIQKNKAVEGINNIEIFDPNTFIIHGSKVTTKEDLKKYSGAHIAIVEDSKVDQRVIRNILKMEGIILYCLNNGEQMLELLEKESIDLIFSDINMPVMDGITMTKKIRSEPKWKNIPIVSISSMVFPQEIKAMQVAGFNASITKPIVAQDLYHALEKFIDIEQVRRREGTSGTRKTSAIPKMPLMFDQFDLKVLNVKTGMAQAANLLEYREMLEETLELVRDTPEKLRILINEGNLNEIKQFSKSMIMLYTNIHANDLVKMFNELSYYITKYNASYLREYVIIYRKKLYQLEKEINTFLKMT